MNVIYRKTDGVIIDFIDGEVSGLNPDLSVGEIEGNFSGTETNISELTLKKITVTCSPYDFLQRFTQAERITIEASSDVYVKDFSSLLKAAQVIDFDDANTLAGMAYLVSLGLLTEERKNEILKH